MIRNGGEWTEARFKSFIKGALRQASMRWPPKHRVKKKAWVKRGEYECAGYRRERHKVSVSVSKPTGGKANNIYVDHIQPIMIEANSWDAVIDAMFCEEDNLQVLCKECHDAKTKEERVAARGRGSL